MNIIQCFFFIFIVGQIVFLRHKEICKVIDNLMHTRDKQVVILVFIILIFNSDYYNDLVNFIVFKFNLY